MTTNCRVAEVQLKYKPQPLTETIKGSADINNLLVSRVYDSETIGYRETFKVLLLNQANRIIGFTTISEGGINCTAVDVRLILQAALLANATSIIISHNHPSGTLNPSPQDDELTRRINAACKAIDVRLLDHIIVSPFGGYYSYCDEGRL